MADPLKETLSGIVFSEDGNAYVGTECIGVVHRSEFLPDMWAWRVFVGPASIATFRTWSEEEARASLVKAYQEATGSDTQGETA